ncbi:aprataxin and PNK-like factor isoform X2 [Sphaerodactylus townsendi]|uniref:aprataxin and PNK-like factor isoform X2 n=1 Tax=Sphaerodactylus townsendi TaxID=933632 RepID=UPI002026F6F9|nr:aprataxin and PNK-like factor isoform X2 [Sphaerodactylus townsendi]
MRNPVAGGPTVMSGFKVAPVDGGCPVALPLGETVIGRGPLLGISDKRVSRKHAILKVTGDQLCIKPVHVNPCFYQPSENSQLLPLKTDEWHRLSPGDNFSLLVDKYVFKVVFTRTEMEGPQSQSSGNPDAEEMPRETSKMPPRQSSQQQPSSSGHSKLLEAHFLLERPAGTPQKLSASVADPEKPRPASRKRQLPSWMLQGDVMVPSSSPLVPGSGNDEGRNRRPWKKQKTTASEQTALSVQGIEGGATESFEPKVENSNSKVVPQIPQSLTVQNECSESSQPGHQAMETDTSAKSETKKESATSKMGNQGIKSPVHQDENEAFLLDRSTKTDISDLAGSSDVTQSSDIIKHRRIPCQYGRNCYRKNPVHFQEFSHPGDDDYHDLEVVTSADNDCRPECPYGTACYRKNPQHKKDYKHSAPPGKSAMGDDSDNDGEPNEYDLNDSFIDDEEEEECDPTDEDSDWVLDFEESESEDVDTLLKEGQKFVETGK